jgi:hypothetical protein
MKAGNVLNLLYPCISFLVEEITVSVEQYLETSFNPHSFELGFPV